MDSNPFALSLFVQQRWTMHSGGVSDYKIECDALTPNDWHCIAFLTHKQFGPIRDVYGVPRGGVPFENALKQFVEPDVTEGLRLIVDDVLVTGASMEEARETLRWDDAVGIVVFARNIEPPWVYPLMSINWPEL